MMSLWSADADDDDEACVSSLSGHIYERKYCKSSFERACLKSRDRSAVGLMESRSRVEPRLLQLFDLFPRYSVVCFSFFSGLMRRMCFTCVRQHPLPFCKNWFDNFPDRWFQHWDVTYIFSRSDAPFPHSFICGVHEGKVHATKFGISTIQLIGRTEVTAADIIRKHPGAFRGSVRRHVRSGGARTLLTSVVRSVHWRVPIIRTENQSKVALWNDNWKYCNGQNLVCLFHSFQPKSTDMIC
jgi:hypothetical protein